MNLVTALRSYVRSDGQMHLFEWACAIGMAGFGMQVLRHAPPPEFSPLFFLTARVPPLCWGIGCTLLGIARIAVLATAGRWRPWCIYSRAALGGISGIILLQLALGHEMVGASTTSWFLVFAVGESVSVWRARRELNGRTPARSR